MTLILNGTDNSATTPAVTGTDTDTGVFFPAANVLAFATSGTEDARFDASGNLLIGQSVDNFPGAGNTVTGGGITASGRISFSAASATVAYLNRNTDDGELLSFRRQGSGVGAVNATTAGITVTGTNGITFTATQTASADANTLDDYEEGTWTPILGGTATYSVQSGLYTKIGRVVTLSFDLTVNSIGTGSTHTILGAPFQSHNNPSGMARLGGPAISWFTNANLSVTSILAGIDTNTTAISLACITTAASSVTNTPNFITSGTRIAGTVTYQASS